MFIKSPLHVSLWNENLKVYKGINQRKSIGLSDHQPRWDCHEAKMVSNYNWYAVMVINAKIRYDVAKGYLRSPIFGSVS